MEETVSFIRVSHFDYTLGFLKIALLSNPLSDAKRQTEVVVRTPLVASDRSPAG